MYNNHKQKESPQVRDIQDDNLYIKRPISLYNK